MRFERLGQQPVAIFEIEVDGEHVHTREGIAGALTSSTTRFASAAAAQAHADARIAEQRANGFIAIRRVAAVAHEESVRRDRRFEWTDRDRRLYREVFQRDDAVRVVDGEVVDGTDRPREPEIVRCFSIREASKTYERRLARTEEDIADAKRRTERLAQKRKVRAQKRTADRFERNVHPALEAECLAAPDDVGPWQVYADWLLERGDPVGDIAALAVAGNTVAACHAAQDHFIELDGPHIELGLRHGFIHHVTVRYHEGEALADRLRRVLVSPACRFIDSIRLGLARPYTDNDWAPALSVITDSHQAPNLRVLRLDAFHDEECMLSHASFGDLAFAWPKLPMLEELRIRGGGEGTLGALDIPKLHTFVHEATALAREEVAALCAIPRPALAHLELWTGSADAGSEILLPELAPIFDARMLPAVRHLGIVNSDLSDELIPALVASRILPQLHSLDLSQGIFARAATTQLVAAARHFRHLAALDLSENLLSDDEIAELRGVLDNIITNGQREREDDFPGDPGMRYVAITE